ncbi:DUF3137 domain-containing protein [Pedobacter sp. AW31-3R]|uniref:DUF3137 domain-containing protein n=1 Tax=Pedobacter sp. AW31-3R TaxID=3445781 RepID=UPI003FA13971
MALENDAALQGILQELEVERLRVSKANVRSFVIIGAGIGFLLVGIFVFPLPPWGFFIGIGIVIAGIVMKWRSVPAERAYQDSFKRKAIGAALRTIDSSLTISPLEGMSEKQFVDTQLFAQTPHRYHSEDQVSGKANKTSFVFSEVHAEYKTETKDSKGRRQEHWHEILKGIVFTADFNKHFHGVTVVRPSDMGSKIGGWIKKAVPIFFSRKSTEVELENIEFSKTFITHSTDQIEARYILTPSMMDKICALDAKCRYTISLSFIDSKMHIAFPLTENYFEGPVYKSLLEPSCLERDISLIRFMYGIVQELDLNTRIWGKE